VGSGGGAGFVLVIALIVLAAFFGVLLVARVGAARRAQLIVRWPALVLATAAILAALRGALTTGLILAGLAAIAWQVWPSINRFGRSTATSSSDPADADAQRALGVGPNASVQEIRRAYRSKMARAHPDRGGSHAEAARLTAARDRLLKKWR
jgi:hypothetical protein